MSEELSGFVFSDSELQALKAAHEARVQGARELQEQIGVAQPPYFYHVRANSGERFDNILAEKRLRPSENEPVALLTDSVDDEGNLVQVGLGIASVKIGGGTRMDDRSGNFAFVFRGDIARRDGFIPPDENVTYPRISELSLGDVVSLVSPASDHEYLRDEFGKHGIDVPIVTMDVWSHYVQEVPEVPTEQ